MSDFEVGGWQVSPSKGTVQKDNQVNTLEPKAMAVLCFLRQHAGEVVSQQAIFSAIWPGRVFSPSSVQRIIALIRRALEDSSQHPQVLFTHPKLGYRLIADTEVSSTPRAWFSIKNISVFLSLVATLLVLLFFMVPSESPATEQITFSQDREYNPRFSPSGEHLAYIRAGETRQLLFQQQVSSGASETKVIKAAQGVLTYVWHDNDSLLVFKRNKTQPISLIRIDQLEQGAGVSALLGEFPLWQKVLAAAPLSATKLLLAVKAQSYALVELDLETMQVNTVKPLPAKLKNVAFATTGNGVMIQYSAGDAGRLLQLLPDNSLITLSAEVPAFATLAWQPQQQQLQLVDTLSGELYVLEQQNILDLVADNKNLIARQYADDSFVAVYEHNDSDLYWTDFNVQHTAVDSKYLDYQGSVNHLGEIAYLSKRSGTPKVYLDAAGQQRLLFDNPNEEEFIAPMVWSDRGDGLALCVAGKLTIIGKELGGDTTLTTPEPCDRVFTWQVDDRIVFQSHSGKLYSHNLSSGNNKRWQPENVKFAGQDRDGLAIVVKEQSLHWGSITKATPAANINAFLLAGQLAVLQKGPQGRRIELYDSNLNKQISIAVPESCLHVNAGKKDQKGGYWWLCTSQTHKDSDIYLGQLP
ncbi:winged helix-turn-helix domain-containing protein [Pseudoalteromonas 'SMAR']|uniref:winged helix-turn-helix domain-containing protein n=1 Tax=Pseudoalteromonas 'SMAR' TaxID=3416908 RepID=UPI003AF20E07